MKVVEENTANARTPVSKGNFAAHRHLIYMLRICHVSCWEPQLQAGSVVSSMEVAQEVLCVDFKPLTSKKL